MKIFNYPLKEEVNAQTIASLKQEIVSKIKQPST